MYTSFVRSKLEYGSIIWKPYSEIHIKRVEKIQRKFIRFALLPLNFIRPLPTYESRCLLIGMQTLDWRRKFSSMLFVFDLVNGNVDCPILLEKLMFNIPCYNLRNVNLFHIDCHRRNYILNSPIIGALRHYNALNRKHMVEFNVTKNSFKEFLKRFLI